MYAMYDVVLRVRNNRTSIPNNWAEYKSDCKTTNKCLSNKKINRNNRETTKETDIFRKQSNKSICFSERYNGERQPEIV